MANGAFVVCLGKPKVADEIIDAIAVIVLQAPPSAIHCQREPIKRSRNDDITRRADRMMGTGRDDGDKTSKTA